MNRPRRLPRPLLSVGVTVTFFVALELALAGLHTAMIGLFWRPRVGPAGGAWSIAVVGDSVAAGGSWTPDRDAWPAQLAQSPAIRTRGYQVVSHARPGSPLAAMGDQVQQFLAAGPAAPRAVLAMGGFNDCHSNLAVPATRGPFPRLGHLRPLLKRTRTYRLATQIVARLADLAAPGPAPSPVDPAPDETCRARIRAGLAALAERARQGDARLVVVTYPVASRQPAYKPRGDLAARALNGLLAAECRAASVPVLDVVDCVQTQERALGDGFFYDDGLHLVPAGSAATARCVARELPGLLEGPKS